MKAILIVLFATLSIQGFSQIQQNVNKTNGTVSQPITQIDSIRFNTTTNQMEIIQTNGNTESHVISDVINVTFSGQLVGTIATLACGTETNEGTLTAYTAASGVSSSIEYTGGNGGPYNDQTINSTGVTGLIATLTAGAFAVGTGNLTFTVTGTPNSSGIANFALNIGGQTCLLTRTVDLPLGVVSFLECGMAANSGTLTDGINAVGVSSSISYSGGNGGSYNDQIVTSTGVTGLTATLTPGTFAIGSGSLTYTISGTPDTSGIASFLINIGGQTCELTINVNLPIGTISLLDCGNATHSGSLTAYTAVTGVSSSIPYSGGNGGTYASQSVVSTGITGLTASLVADTLAYGTGDLIYNISGTPSGEGTATFLIEIGGQSCSKTWTVDLPVGVMNTLDCGSSADSGSLFAYTVASGVSSSIPYSGGNGGTHSGQAVTSTGITGLTATLSSGIFAIGSGSLNYIISGTPSSIGTASFLLDIGGQTCTLMRTVSLPDAAVSSLSCGTASVTGTFFVGLATSGASISIPYTGGNGGIYSEQSVSSTGSTGLTATLSAGTVSIGSGNLIYNIAGTAANSGTASFALSIGDQNCVLTITVNSWESQYPANSIFCSSGPTIIVNVTNPITGRIWMDRNLGSSQAATSSTDINAYGDLYQWGRRTDGHQCRNSATTNTLSPVDTPPGNFITSGTSPYDWRSPQNNNLWQGVNGINNPCPLGYRLPTDVEWTSEVNSWGGINNSTGAFNSPLKLPLPGYRRYDGVIVNVGILAGYWSSKTSSPLPGNAFELIIAGNNALGNNQRRAQGNNIRCIKN